MAEVRLQKECKGIECGMVDIMDEHLDGFPV